MGKLVEVTQLRYYGNVRRRPGDQFVMADSDFQRPVLDKDGKQKMSLLGKPEFEDYMPTGVIVVEDGYEDPVMPKEADIKPTKREPQKAVKKQPDDHRQGGAFDVHPESGIQVTGQVAPARPAASSVQNQGAPAPASGKEDKKSSGDKNVL